MTYWKSADFKALQKEWYERLEAEGFRDAEEIRHDEIVLKQWAAHPLRCNKLDQLTITVRQNYFLTLTQQIHEEQFRSEVDELILRWYADGKAFTDICLELEARGMRRCRQTVLYTIRKYEMKWGMKKYTPKQLNKRVG